MNVTAGEIVLARHGRPALSRRVVLSGAQYRDWWARYEVGGIAPGQTPPPALVETASGVGVIVTSIRRRAIESARLVAGGRPILEEAVFVEAPLPPPSLPPVLRLSPRLWGTLTRFCWWFLDLHDDEESRGEAEARARQAADRLIALSGEGGVLLVAHGFFNTMIARELRSRKWTYAANEGWKYWSTKRFEPPPP